MVFDTAAGQLPAEVFHAEVAPQLEILTQKFPLRLGYYSKDTQPAHLRHSLFTEGGWAGVAVDQNWDLRTAFDLFPRGFIQGSFDPALLLCERDELNTHLRHFLDPLLKHDRTGWVCGLGHGVLPATPEENVRLFVNTVREVLQ